MSEQECWVLAINKTISQFNEEYDLKLTGFILQLPSNLYSAFWETINKNFELYKQINNEHKQKT
jgi:hypothetical protein